MPLIENTLFGQVDRVKVAIERLKTFEPEEGYWVGDSGGKDSEVVRHIVKLSGVKAHYFHSLTTIDAPQTVHHIKKHHKDCEIIRPEMPLMQMMLKKGIPPMRNRRWCCAVYKERGGRGNFICLGVRKGESYKRASRKVVESCYKDDVTRFLNPIVDWSTQDVWQYIRENKLPYNPLYDPPYNFDRIGCVLCPMVRDIERQMRFFPRICANWKRWIFRLYEQQKEKGKMSHPTPESFWMWWIDRDRKTINLDQTTLFE